MLLERLENLPAPFSVHGIASDAVHHEQTLYRLGSLQVVSVEGLDDEVLFPLRQR